MSLPGEPASSLLEPRATATVHRVKWLPPACFVRVALLTVLISPNTASHVAGQPVVPIRQRRRSQLCLGKLSEEGSFFNYCRAKGEAAPRARGERANLAFSGSSLRVAASQLRAALQIASCPGSSRARTGGFITAGFEKCQQYQHLGAGPSLYECKSKAIGCLNYWEAQIKAFLPFL